MDAETAMGTSVMSRQAAAVSLKVVLAAVGIVWVTASSALAGERFALVVTGASGGEQYAQQYDSWRTSFVNILRDTWNYPDDHVIVLAETAREGTAQATRENVRRV